MYLSRLLAKHRNLGRTGALQALAQGRVRVAGAVTRDSQLEVDRFADVMLDEVLVQQGETAVYIMLHKPAGHVSATSDPEHPTVVDLIQHPLAGTLHLAGRLDRFSSGLVLLTNDGRWSKRLTEPGEKVGKVYRVETEQRIPPEAVPRFLEGFYFATEDLVTQPAHLEILAEHRARVTLHEGRYHQIKRMFHRIDGIRLTSLHRVRIGPHELPEDLAAGQWRVIAGID